VTSCIVDSAAIYIMVVKFRNTTCPPQPQLPLHRRAALSSDSNGTRSYIAERTQSAVYIVRCLWIIRLKCRRLGFYSITVIFLDRKLETQTLLKTFLVVPLISGGGHSGIKVPLRLCNQAMALKMKCKMDYFSFLI
jgi:hypothetical protein